MLSAASAHTAILCIQAPKLGRQRTLANQCVATTLAARIWVQSGKITGFVAAAPPQQQHHHLLQQQQQPSSPPPLPAPLGHGLLASMNAWATLSVFQDCL
jgi:hypothetical protein